MLSKDRYLTAILRRAKPHRLSYGAIEKLLHRAADALDAKDEELAEALETIDILSDDEAMAALAESDGFVIDVAPGKAIINGAEYPYVDEFGYMTDLGLRRDIGGRLVLAEEAWNNG